MPQEYPAPPFPAQGLTPPGSEKKMDPRPRYEAPHYKGSGKLLHQVALVTGGDSGIGRAVAVLMAREGADIAISFLPEEGEDAHETQRAVEKEGQQCHLLPGDVREFKYCQSAVADVVNKLGKLDILVNNAAYQMHRDSPEELSLEQWDLTFKTNIYGYFYMVKAALPHLGEGSVIINTGSETGLEGSERLLDYSATKGAIHAFTKALAQNLLARGIRVNCVAPGPVWTPLNPAERSKDEAKQFGSGTPMGRPAQPEEIAPSFIFFASASDSNYITGEVLTLLGGATMAG